MRHFPDFQHDYAPMSVQLENLGLQGSDRAKGIQENLAEILKGDASDATNRLGGEECPLFDDLCWAREVKKAFDNGIGDIIKTALDAKQQNFLNSPSWYSRLPCVRIRD